MPGLEPGVAGLLGEERGERLVLVPQGLLEGNRGHLVQERQVRCLFHRGQRRVGLRVGRGLGFGGVPGVPCGKRPVPDDADASRRSGSAGQPARGPGRSDLYARFTTRLPRRMFWQLFVRPAAAASGRCRPRPTSRPTARSCWPRRRRAGTAGRAKTLVAGVRPSLDLSFSPITRTSDLGRSWATQPPQSGLADVPDALAAAPGASGGTGRVRRPADRARPGWHGQRHHRDRRQLAAADDRTGAGREPGGPGVRPDRAHRRRLLAGRDAAAGRDVRRGRPRGRVRRNGRDLAAGWPGSDALSGGTGLAGRAAGPGTAAEPGREPGRGAAGGGYGAVDQPADGRGGDRSARSGLRRGGVAARSVQEDRDLRAREASRWHRRPTTSARRSCDYGRETTLRQRRR